MKKQMKSLLTGALLMMATSAMATTINYLSTNTANNKTSLYTGLSGFQIETFNGVALGDVAPGNVTKAGLLWDWDIGTQDNAMIVNGSLSGKYAAPFGLSQPDQTNYVSVPNPFSTGSVTVGLGGMYDYFGLWWGSVDSYNTLSFLKAGVVVASFTGTQVVNPSAANGNQTAPSTNIYVNFFDLPDFDSFKMTSTQYAFEVDNIAIGRVPEPGTILLFGLGMLGMTIFGKRRLSKAI